VPSVGESLSRRCCKKLTRILRSCGGAVRVHRVLTAAVAQLPVTGTYSGCLHAQGALKWSSVY
jgi:hypothetical protein